MSNEFDTMYINNLVDRDYPPMPMLAAADTGRLPEVVVTGEAEPRFGRGGVTKARSEAAGGLEVPAMGLADTLAGALRGTVAQSLGLPGDIESLVRLLTGGEQVLPTTERVSEMLPPVVPPGAPDMVGYSAAERRKTADVAGKLGEFNPIVGAPEAVKIGVKGAKAVGEALAPAAGKLAEDYLRKTGATMAVAPESVAKQVTDPMPRVDSIQRFPVGPASIKPKVIASDMPLYREMNVDNLTDFLRNDSQFAYSPAFVTDNPDLAIGQGANKGVKVTFRANSVSGEEHTKPMAGAMAGKEYKADVVAPRAIESITFASESALKKVKSLAASVLKKEFERVADNGGNITFVRKMQPQEKK